MAARVQVIIEGKDNASNEIKKVALSLTDVNSAVQLASQALQKLKQGYDFAKGGAEIEFLREKFDRLSTSIGMSSDVLLDKMQVATKGTLSEMEAIASVTDLVSLGLARTGDEAIRLATVQAGLGMDMNQLVLALANQTTMRFDQLGLAVTGFDEKVKKLEETGMSASDAFQEAFLQQAEEQLLRVGNAADSTLGDFQRFEAQLKNFKDEAKMVAGDALGPLIGKLGESMAANREWDEILQKVNPELFRQFQYSQFASDEMNNVVFGYKRAAETGLAWEAALAKQATAAAETIPAIQDLTIATQEVSAANTNMLSTIQSVESASQSYRETQESLREKMAALKEEYHAGKIPQDEYKQKTKEITAAVKENELAHIAAGNKIVFSLMQQKMAVDGLSDTEMAALERMGIGMGIFSEESVEMAKNFMEAADNVVNNAGAMDDALRDPLGAMTGINEKIEGFEKKSGAMWDFYINIHTTGRIPNLPELNQANQAAVQLCFVAGTLVTMADGKGKPIEDVIEGDEVLTFDFKTQANITTKVTQVFHHAAEQTKFYLVFNDHLGVTPNHQLYTPFGWLEAGTLNIGDALVDIHGNEIEIVSIAVVGESVPTYNLHVDNENHNYYANDILVHNKQTGGTVYAGMPYMVGERGPEPFMPSQNGRILGHAESLHALGLQGGGGGTNYFYGNVTIEQGANAANDIMSIR